MYIVHVLIFNTYLLKITLIVLICTCTCITTTFPPPLSEVWLGEYRGSKVAIKMLKEIKSQQQTQQFLAEASVMTLVYNYYLLFIIIIYYCACWGINVYKYLYCITFINLVSFNTCTCSCTCNFLAR